MQTTAVESVLAIHVMGGLIAIAGGFAALAFRKGSLEHRNAGVTFFWGMMIMSVGAAWLGYIRSELNDIVAAVTIAYLVTTARWAIQGEATRGRFLEAGAFVVAIGITIANVAFALRAANAGGTLYGHSAILYWISAAITAFTASLDLNFVVRGVLSWRHRLVRHLSRMCFALWIAVASFFLGQMKVFPDVLRNVYLLATPVLVVFLAMIYWLVRMLMRRADSLPGRRKEVSAEIA